MGAWGVVGERNLRGITMSASGRENGGKSMNEMEGTRVGAGDIIVGTIMITVVLVQSIARLGSMDVIATETGIWTESGTRALIETVTMEERKTSPRGEEIEVESGRVLAQRSGTMGNGGVVLGAARRLEKERSGICTMTGGAMIARKR